MTEKRGRVVTSKPTRQGCRTCRLRHIKCDETRPRCNRCTSSGRLCPGYPPTGSPRNNNTTRQLLPLEIHGPTLCTMPSPTLDATEYERYAFDHFRRMTARQITLSTPRAWMTQLVLHLSLEIPVFRAIAALGSIHRGLVQITHVGFVHTLFQDQNALNQYGKAIITLQRHIGESKSRSSLSLEPILCACILLASCEILKSDTTAAISHIRFGNKISISYDPTKRSRTLYDTKTSRTLASMFKLLGENCIALETGSAENYPPVLSLPVSSTPPSDLETLRVTLDRLISAERELRIHFLRLAQLNSSQDLIGKSIVEKWCIDYCTSRIIQPNLNNNLSSRLQQLITQHASWMISFKVTLEALDLPLRDKKTKRSLILLQIQHFYSAFLLISCRSAREVPNDIFHDEYCRILDLAERYFDYSRLADGNVRESSNMRANFAVEPVILPALYLIALKCRDSIVRRRAIRLLASMDRLEGFQKSRSLAAFALQIVGAEERKARALTGLSPTYEQPLSAEQVPEAARFLDVTVSLAPRRPSDAQIVGGRFAFERGGQLEVIGLTSKT